ncbi:restriction endonuclease [Clostridium sp. C8-1-8]|uniref:restriction endonuclease n=1 Tax=Clostridium sp. C8-1-8 TaxID=2698831 RepID=UPI0013698BEB|nr:restriction endonuclease [Clostridium sp. C8-1-8]
MKYRSTKEGRLRKFIFLIYCILIGKTFFYDGYSNIIMKLILYSVILFFIYLGLKRYIKKKVLKSGIDKIDRLSGEDFEEYLAVKFKALGYKVKLTPVTADYGADLVLKKDKEKIVVQAKRYSSKVGVEAVQQVVASMKYYDADKSIVITNNYFTENAKILAKCNSVELLDRKYLYQLLEMDSKFRTRYEDKKLCPRCGAKLVVREGKYGKFYGCESYPNCNFTMNLDNKVKDYNFNNIIKNSFK